MKTSKKLDEEGGGEGDGERSMPLVPEEVMTKLMSKPGMCWSSKTRTPTSTLLYTSSLTPPLSICILHAGRDKVAWRSSYPDQSMNQSLVFLGTLEAYA